MPDSDLTKETREALLTAIKADAEGRQGSVSIIWLRHLR
ncbi:Uncharacterised protein [Mycobacteroides abscessus]|nr:Uncharacterised protein [Mycobacteroides abscessus]CPW13348.1 Uncharacterised protein [Mycobacteroides abscessus]CPW96520.1 Uncharacterised protein [Mycobacteroides abscessus]CQA08350.1 Uncharacterised protein [Mycobacteroides abscessus]SLI98756.1 Uncharacterised protein [Mycobacteroides abscessus subsp. massiliense]